MRDMSRGLNERAAAVIENDCPDLRLFRFALASATHKIPTAAGIGDAGRGAGIRPVNSREFSDI
jgi:hypothetical protein